MSPTIQIHLLPLDPSDKEQFIRDNQEAFNYGALQENPNIAHQFEEEGQIISRQTIEESIANGQAFRIILDDEVVGGLVVKVAGDQGELDLLFVSPKSHSKGIGLAAWQAVEKLFPQVKVWQTVTPYFEQRNIHFYVNRCGFHIVEFYNRYHPDPNDPESSEAKDDQFPDGMFRFEKRIQNE